MRLYIKIYLWIVAFCWVTNSYSQDTLKLNKGVVVDSLKASASGDYFSIYLPKAYDESKNWPILFGFNSSGEASQISYLYKAAAEEYGYIIAVSNFSNDIETKEKTNYAISFMNHIFSLFSIQKNRVYVTGIREDAKFISLLPILYNKDVFGVIAIEDSYYYDSSIKIKNNFSYLGIVNTHNFRYRDFLKNKRYLRKKGVQADIFGYQGKSKSSDPDLYKKALSIFTLHAMNTGRMPKDSIWIQNLFKKDLKRVETYLINGEFTAAYDEVKRVRTEYQLFFDTSDLKDKQKEIKKNKGYRREKQLQTKYLYRENFLRQTYLFSINEDVQTESYENLGWWQYQVAQIDTMALSKEKYEYAMASRMKGYLKHLVDGYKIAQLERNKNFEKKMFLNILSTIVDKRDFESYRTIISLSAVDQDYETALFYLERLLQNGYKDFDALYTIEGTLALRMSEDYNKLVKKHLGKAKYFFSK